jgi:transcription initiation factor TFIID subunit 2
MEKSNPTVVDVVPPQVASHLLVGEPSSDWQRKAGKVLSQISRLEHTEPFLRPVPKDFMNYYEVIRRPMDLGAIKSKLADGRYIDPSQLIADMELIWSNCLKFNQSDAPIIDDCEKTKEAFEKAWVSAKVMIPDATGGAKVEERAVTRTDDWVEQARGVLYRLINFVPQASWFYDPVDEEDAPGYKDVVKTPMDLQTISEKLQSGKYPAPGNLLADMELITKNAEAYNGADDEITEGAHAVAAAFKKYWVNAGLGSANVAFDSPDDWISKATSTIETVLAHPSSEPFAQPVSERTAPGYSRLIKRPMDFSTILFNLQRNSYGSPGQVIDDVAQIFQNCRIYNPPGDEIRAMGSETESIFRKTWESMGLPVPRKWKKR